MQNVLELQSSDDLVDFFRIINNYQCFFTLTILFDYKLIGDWILKKTFC